MRRIFTLLPSLAIVLLSAEAVHAAYITGVTASTDMGSGFGTSLTNTVNGVGLSSLSLTATHAATIPTNSWVSAPGILTGNVTFNLNGLYDLTGFSFWNQNGGGPGLNGSTGIRGVQVLTSLDGIIFTPKGDAPSEFAQVPGNVNLPPQVVTFGTVTASFVRFSIASNWGDPFQTGFAEVAFDGTLIPEPSSLILSGLGGVFLTGSSLVRRAMRRKTVNKMTRP